MNKRNLLYGLYIAAVFVVIVLTGLLLVNKPKIKKVQQPSVQTPVQTKEAAAKLGLTLFATGFSNPTSIVSTNSPGDKRLFVTERDGRIQIVSGNGVVSETPFLDISSKVLSSGEMGLLGLAFHPKFKSNGEFFVNYVDKDQNTVVSRFKIASNDAADPATEEVLLQIHQPYTNHNGGDLKFGPDGYLYIPLGDGGAGGDPENRAQNLNELLGKILRIDVDSGEPYSIPKTNPFVGKEGTKGEIWDYGLRNPWRLSFDRSTGEKWIADVGQGNLEEIDLEPGSSKGGVNYGWRCYEGNSAYNATGCDQNASYKAPLLAYDHSEKRCSVTGGYVYRGSRNLSFVGQYFYGDYCSGDVFVAKKTSDSWEGNISLKTPYKISTFGEDSVGEVYLADFATGSVYQIIQTK